MKTTVRALLLALALTSVPVAAHATDPFEPAPTDDPKLVAAWEAWESKGIDDYATTVRHHCYCLPIPPVRTVVRDGEIHKVMQDGRRRPDGKGHSMDQLFLMLRDAYDNADRVEVTYTPRGVPKSISIDWDEVMVDEEQSYNVTLVRR
ncbi:DUF6174 domain-containing protein [Nocardioides sp.]|uniref:DUF6174 domain-containing protein n=1 Tax=Nocardioides sp. TaxID=35761 RepID=UPI002CF55DC7|nr:DUF6174 domain-containing protein [Nocardioides sp.]HXH81280.1 DUF6174 domain-containing protein [Nocardioides sp.]